MIQYRIILKNKNNDGIINIDLKSNNIYSYIQKHNINTEDIIKIIQYKGV